MTDPNPDGPTDDETGGVPKPCTKCGKTPCECKKP